MLKFDIFGLHKDIPADDTKPEPAPQEPPRSWRPLWGFLAFLFGGFSAGLAGAAGWRAYGLLFPPAQLVSAPMHRLASAPKPAVSPAPPAAAPAAPAPPAAAAKPPQPRPAQAAAKPPQEPVPAPPERRPLPRPRVEGPIGSPSVNSPELPQRGTPDSVGSPKTPTPPAQPAAQVESPAPKRVRVKSVDFTYSDPDAREVNLLGPFLVSTEGRKALSKDPNGLWKTSVYLAPGPVYRYQYEFIDSQGGKHLTPKQSLEPF